MPTTDLLQQLQGASGARPVNDTPLNEIGFAEFTAKLITDVFNALVSANMTQTQSYLLLMQSVSKDLTTFINDTRDDIAGAQILDLLTRLLPDAATGSSKVVKGGTLQPDEAKTLGRSLAIANDTDVTHGALLTRLDGAGAPLKIAEPVDGGGPAWFDAIIQAAARRIAADKYTLLKELVKMGLLRLVVEHGVIETRLCYNTYASAYHAQESSNYTTGNMATQMKVGGGLMGFLIGGPSMSVSTNTLTVSTARSTDRDISGSSVQVFGRVQIDFKTDYQPLSS